MTETAKCAHGPCSCKPAEGEAYCSDWCEHEATSGPPRTETVCDCPHSVCTARGHHRGQAG